MKKIQMLVYILILLADCFVASAQYPVIDLRDDITAPKNWVGFVVRNNTASGHAFVVLGKENAQKGMTEITIQGFYPSGQILASPGEIRNDFESLKFVQHADQLYFIVNDADFSTASQLVNTWSEHPPRYNVMTNNCIDLVQRVTESIGIDLPSRGPLSVKPSGYLSKVKGQLTSKDGLNYYKINGHIKQLPEGSYRGRLEGGKPNGSGVLVAEHSVYNGHFKNGKPNGKGKFSNGTDTYEGEFKNGLPEGQGSLSTPTQFYKGGFKAGRFDGMGELVDKTHATTTIGMFYDGKINGKVTVISENGNATNIFELKDGKFVGPTETVYKDGSKRTTLTDENGVPQSSTYTGSNGTKIFMTYQNGRPFSSKYSLSDGREIDIQKYYEGAVDSGYGTVKSKDYTYTGDLKSLMFDGKGELTSNGTVQKGDFKKGRIEGKNEHVQTPDFTFDGDIWYDKDYSYQRGSMTLSNGDTYKGDLRNYRFHGWGTYSHQEPHKTVGNSNSFTVKDIFTDGKGTMRPVTVPAAAAFPDLSAFKIPLSDFPRIGSASTPPTIAIPWALPAYTPGEGWHPWIQTPVILP